jgi:hypothetical protein
MSKSVLVLLLICSLILIAPAQRRSVPRANRGGRLSQSHPSVYISFVREAKIASARNGGMEQTVWLRLHNNTRWPIRLDASGIPKEYGDAELYYAVEDTNKGEALFGSTECHVCSSVSLASGQSLIFSLPREYLVKGHRIRIDFSYDWEKQNDVFAGREVEHSVFFYGSNLPESNR